MTSRPDKTDAEQRMLGAVPGEPALGRGPAPDDDYSRHEYHHPAAGWGAARSVAGVLERARRAGRGRPRALRDEPRGRRLRLSGLRLAGRPDGPAPRHLRERHQARHLGARRAPKADREFFAAHTVSELAGWSDYDLEAVGRLAEPMSYDPATDKYVPISWDDAFALVGDTLRGAGEPAPGGVLHLRAAQQRGDLPLPALGARVRHEQPAGLLEHVPRGERPGADRGDRHRQGHRRPAATGSRPTRSG